MRAVHVVVRGRVQGVGFRWFTREAANAHGVTGWVRNLPDGSVEALLCGADAEVDAVLAKLRTGPPFAHVDDVGVSDAEDSQLREFEIRR
ncbi:Acylphosphate phosphohydrolase, putative [Microbacterium esteraromaticum]|uniref:Acylphosphatase n=1 Tax=Microbacterium esteraromaticum TaxID=57043 RepID=A0A1R4IEJ9_9MICO|nr:acylphosphatase [Microbacterium esteraromaticum]SJN17743.1 Acylphosphate phosphohydrolase, putative [Microbacterium esteraromaticum]